MEALVVGLVALACPVGMAVMMWLMMRRSRGHDNDEAAQQVARLRAEVDQLRGSAAPNVSEPNGARRFS